MKKFIFIFLLLSSTVYAQDENVYYNKDGKVTIKDNASFYRVKPIKKGNLWLIKEYYINGTIQFKGTVKNIEDESWHGDLTWYYLNGRIKSKERYKDGIYIGSFVAFESSDSSQEKGFEEKDLYFYDETTAKPDVAVSEAIDTLRVYQNDTTMFTKIDYITHRPCSNPEMGTSYRLKKPENNVYYYIYNEKQQLVNEGQYTSHYTYKGVEYEGGFYNIKYFTYRKNGSLHTVHYQEDGRNSKIEFYSRRSKLKKIRYLDKETETPTKTEFYKKNKLKKTRVYTNYYANKYYTIKEKNRIK